MPHVLDGAEAAARLEGAVEHRQVPVLQVRGPLDGVVLLQVLQDLLALLRVVTQALQGLGDRLVHDLDHSAAYQLLVLDQGDVGLDPGGVAVHHETDGAGGGDDRGLGIAVAMLLAPLHRLVPRLARRLQQVQRHVGRVDLRYVAAVLVHHLEERGAVLLVAGEGAGHFRRDARRGGVGLAGHQRGDGAGVVAPLVGVVGEPPGHEQRAQVGVAEAQRAEGMAVPRDRLGGVAGVAHDDLLGGDHQLHRVTERDGIELAILPSELHQVQGRQVARRVVEEHVLTAVVDLQAVGDEVVGRLFGQVEDRLFAQGLDGRHLVGQLVPIGSELIVHRLQSHVLRAGRIKADLALKNQAGGTADP